MRTDITGYLNAKAESLKDVDDLLSKVHAQAAEQVTLGFLTMAAPLLVAALKRCEDSLNDPNSPMASVDAEALAMLTARKDTVRAMVEYIATELGNHVVWGGQWSWRVIEQKGRVIEYAVSCAAAATDESTKQSWSSAIVDCEHGRLLPLTRLVLADESEKAAGILNILLAPNNMSGAVKEALHLRALHNPGNPSRGREYALVSMMLRMGQIDEPVQILRERLARNEAALAKPQTREEVLHESRMGPGTTKVMHTQNAHELRLMLETIAAEHGNERVWGDSFLMLEFHQNQRLMEYVSALTQGAGEDGHLMSHETAIMWHEAAYGVLRSYPDDLLDLVTAMPQAGTEMKNILQARLVDRQKRRPAA